MPKDNSRRRFLTTTGAAAIGFGLAGCIGDDDDDPDDGADDTDDDDGVDDGDDDADTTDDDDMDDGDDGDLPDDGDDDDGDPDDTDDADPDDGDDTPLGEGVETIPPVAEDDVLLWLPMSEGIGDVTAAEIDAYGDSDGDIDGATWIEGDWMGGTTLEAGGQFDDEVPTSTWGDFGSTTVTGDHTACITMDIPTGGEGVVLGARNAFQFTSWIIQIDGRADTRAGLFVRPEADGDVPNYISSNSSITGEGKVRVAYRIVGHDAEDWEVYINGEEDDTVVIEASAEEDHWEEGWSDFTEDFTLFSYNNQGAPDRPIQGALDDFVLYDRALDPEEIEDDFDRQPWA